MHRPERKFGQIRPLIIRFCRPPSLSRVVTGGLVKNHQSRIIGRLFSFSGHSMKPHFAIVLLTLMLSTAAQAGTYKWVDKDGNVVYSQHPPPSGHYESIRVKPAPRKDKATPTAQDSTKQFLEEADRQRRDEAKVKTELAKTRELRAKNCATAKKQLEFYTVYRRKKDATGEYVRITDTEREAGMKEAKQAIKDFCD